MKYGFIGCGNMGGAVARAVCKGAGSGDVLLANRTPAKAQALADELGCACGTNEEVAGICDFIFLGVKPQMMADMLDELTPTLEARAESRPFVLVTMAAGLSMQQIRQMAGSGYPIIRMMPNTPVALGEGMIQYCSDDVEPEKMADAVLGDFIGDAAAWAEYLSRQDFRRVVLIGHSEGALIAFCAAQQCPEVDAVISLAGAGYPLDEILQLQLAAQLAPTHMELLMQARAITAALKRGERVESCPPELAPLFAPPLQTFWISSLSYDPREEIRKVTVPVLIVNGDIDFQVTPDNRRTGESPAPVPENDHRRHDPHTQKSLRPHAHGADRRLYGRYASGRSGAGRRRHRIHRRTLRFAFRRFSAGGFPSFDYFGYF